MSTKTGNPNAGPLEGVSRVRVPRPVWDPRLSHDGEEWYWNGVHVPKPIPRDSEVSRAIALACRQSSKGQGRHSWGEVTLPGTPTFRD